MSYFCDIYENIRLLVSACFLISIFLVLIGFQVDSKFLYKRMVLIGFTGTIILTVALVLMPSKVFVCGA